ncbi:hypothetical protein V8G54_032370 [Vigna mungo]|uniref:Uncharacterized protein n=1 Tax=Vigna mungo TaxID=3915 RepID=A0AAQ3RHS8_VIGMU
MSIFTCITNPNRRHKKILIRVFLFPIQPPCTEPIAIFMNELIEAFVFPPSSKKTEKIANRQRRTLAQRRKQRKTRKHRNASRTNTKMQCFENNHQNAMLRERPPELSSTVQCFQKPHFFPIAKNQFDPKKPKSLCHPNPN